MFGVLSVAALLALDAASTPAAAAPKRISGELSKPGYTVIALDKDGEAASAQAQPKFKLTPPAKRATLHLRAKDGTYAGPIVTARERKGKRAIVGVKEGVKLGEVTVNGRKGYAKLERSLLEKWVDTKREARAKNGVPIGSGVFGRVASRPTGVFGPGQDQDLDGIPGALDIDDDGDLLLDNFERSNAAGAQAAQSAGELLDVLTQLGLQLEDTANANAGSSDAQIESALPASGRLLIEILPGDSPELDCGGSPNPSPPPPLVGGLVYCSWGGTGRVFQAGVSPSDWPHFPDCCDPDGDGFGTLTQEPTSPGPAFFLPKEPPPPRSARGTS